MSQSLCMMSPTKFYFVNQIILQMWSCDQKFGNCSISMREVFIVSVLQGLDQKNQFFGVERGGSGRWSQFKFNNLQLPLDMGLILCINVEKGLKLKVRKFQRLVPTFVEVTEEKLAWGFFPPSRIRLNSRKNGARLHSSKRDVERG